MNVLTCSNVSAVGVNLGNLTLNLSASINVTLYLLGISTGAPCLHLKAFLSSLSALYGFKLVWIPIDKVHSPLLSRAVSILSAAGMVPAVPITLVIRDNKTVAVVEGEVLDKGFWLRLLNATPAKNVVEVYLGTKLVKVIKNAKSQGYGHLLPILAAALTDSLNPIGLTILSVVMVYCVSTKGKCYREAALFLASYVLAHMTLGFVLSNLPISSLYPALGVLIASLVIAMTVRPTKRVRKIFGGLSNKLSVMALKGASVALIGAAAGSVAMSPCVVGAFLSAMSMLGSLPPSQRLGYLIIYALIYPVPALIVTILVHRGKSFVEPRKMITVLASISLALSLYSLLKQLGYHP